MIVNVRGENVAGEEKKYESDRLTAQQHQYQQDQPPPNVDREAEQEYTTGMQKLNTSSYSGDRDHTSAYMHLSRAAARNHTRAMEEVAIALVFGDHMTRNLTEARRLFEHLSSVHGMPRSQFYLGFMFATGLGMKASNQAKALVHLTFAALGGDSMAQMAMGYRHWAGISVVSSCEMALSYYKKVATAVASKISSNSVGTVVHRIRLYDEEEKVGSTSQVMLDDDLVQYYQLLADRGDIQAQYGLGLLHYQGARGLNIQYDKALHYFSRAAEAGNNYAMAYLGKLYLEGGPFVAQNNQTAIKYFKMAADKGKINIVQFFDNIV